VSAVQARPTPLQNKAFQDKFLKGFFYTTEMLLALFEMFGSVASRTSVKKSSLNVKYRKKSNSL
jgi:hypothetical protein